MCILVCLKITLSLRDHRLELQFHPLLVYVITFKTRDCHGRLILPKKSFEFLCGLNIQTVVQIIQKLIQEKTFALHTTIMRCISL